MSVDIGIGFSQAKNKAAAAESAAQQSRNQLGPGAADAAIVLSTMDYPPEEILPAVQNVLTGTQIIGGTTAGIIVPQGMKRHGVAVLTLRADDAVFRTVHASHLNTRDLETAGRSFLTDTAALQDLDTPRGMVFFFDGLLENMSGFMRGVETAAGVYFPVIAGGTSDQLFFSRTFQYHEQSASSFSACGLAAGGDISFYLARRHGWKPLGKPRLVTKAQKNIIETIGHAPAFQLYEEFFRDNPESLGISAYGKINARYPLGLFSGPRQEYLLRNVMDILEDGSLACQDSVPEGSEVHLMIGNKASCLQSAAHAAADIKKILRIKKPRCLLMFESAMRWQIMKYSWPEELQTIRNILGHDVPIFGMLTYGEIFHPGTVTSAGEIFTLGGNIVLAAIV